MKKRVLCISIIALLFNSRAFTANQSSDPPNNCIYLSIMISNNTKETCQLIDSQVLYGRMSSSTQAPVLIPPGTSAYPFEMRQLVYGPDIILTYECGVGHRVSFETQQDLCVMISGEITGKVIYASDLSAKNTQKRGSYLWSTHGSIHWMLS